MNKLIVSKNSLLEEIQRYKLNFCIQVVSLLERLKFAKQTKHSRHHSTSKTLISFVYLLFCPQAESLLVDKLAKSVDCCVLFKSF